MRAEAPVAGAGVGARASASAGTGANTPTDAGPPRAARDAAAAPVHDAALDDAGASEDSGVEPPATADSDVERPATAPPIDVPAPRAWHAVQVSGAVCDDDTPALFRINVEPTSDKLLIFLEQGGACVAAACVSVHDDSAGNQGVFDRQRASNPFRAWNYVYVPYCTGDLHAGDRRDAEIDGTRHQFVGYRNLGLFLDRIVPTFPRVTQVALVGASAGGFGATLNFPRVQRAFGSIEVVLIVDSAPLMAAPVLASCEQQLWREAWNLEATVLRDCGADCPNPMTWAGDFWRHILTRHPNRRGGIFSNDADLFIRTLYGVGLGECNPPLLPIVSDRDYAAGLLALRDLLTTEPLRFGVYIVPGASHICFEDECFHTTAVAGNRLDAWVSELLAGTARNVGP